MNRPCCPHDFRNFEIGLPLMCVFNHFWVLVFCSQCNNYGIWGKMVTPDILEKQELLKHKCGRLFFLAAGRCLFFFHPEALGENDPSWLVAYFSKCAVLRKNENQVSFGSTPQPGFQWQMSRFSSWDSRSWKCFMSSWWFSWNPGAWGGWTHGTPYYIGRTYRKIIARRKLRRGLVFSSILGIVPHPASWLWGC